MELCIDNLTRDSFTPLRAPLVHDVMTSLWKLLKPLPHNPQHMPVALRILGKLGGRNQQVLCPKAIEWNDSTHATRRLSLQKEWVNIFEKHYAHLFINGI